LASAQRASGLELLVRRGLQWLFRAEATVACAGLALVILALLADVVARELLGSGLFGAQRFAVYSNSIASLLGFAIVVHTGGHLRMSFLDKVLPEPWNSRLARFGDALSAVLCMMLAYFAFRFVRSTFVLGDTDAVFQIRIWPIQAILPYIFLSASLRYVCYVLFPGLRPQELYAGDTP
jgi:TRAP-type C4-dicarboxylate transport system permease small subunit